jgi:hypothetical protein
MEGDWKTRKGRIGGMKRLEVFGSLVLILLFSSCLHNPVAFDEVKWRKQVEGQSVEKLYASHFNDGKYFSPWMPMEHGGFWRFLEWKLSSKAQYSEEERNFKPKFIPI